MGRWKHESWTRVVKGVNSAATSPLAANFDTLPEHLQFVAAVGAEALSPPPGTARDTQTATPSLLAGGDFENLQQMIGTGWRHFEHAQPNVQTTVELSPAAPYSGQFCLKITAQPHKPDAAATLIESTPLWITSAPAHLESGDIVCIRGRVRIAKPITGSIDGLMIIDSLGGESLAERMNQASGWKPFVLYRAAPYSTDMTVTFALTGLGEVDIDDVTVHLVRRGGSFLKSSVASDRLLNGAIGSPAAAPGTMLNSWIAPPTSASQGPTGVIGGLNADATTKR
jgi:hypothetical protein